MYNQRALEILDLCLAEGMTLPMPVEDILAIEEAGGAVDLRTGEVLPGAADWSVILTVVGEATVVALNAEDAPEVQS